MNIFMINKTLLSAVTLMLIGIVAFVGPVSANNNYKYNQGSGHKFTGSFHKVGQRYNSNRGSRNSYRKQYNNSYKRNSSLSRQSYSGRSSNNYSRNSSSNRQSYSRRNSNNYFRNSSSSRRSYSRRNSNNYSDGFRNFYNSNGSRQHSNGSYNYSGNYSRKHSGSYYNGFNDRSNNSYIGRSDRQYSNGFASLGSFNKQDKEFSSDLATVCYSYKVSSKGGDGGFRFQHDKDNFKRINKDSYVNKVCGHDGVQFELSKIDPATSVSIEINGKFFNYPANSGNDKFVNNWHRKYFSVDFKAY